MLIGGIGAVGALTGAMILALVARGRAAWIAAGAVAGTIGALLFVLPLDFCMFDVERGGEQALLGGLLIAAGIALTVLPLRWLALHGWAGLTAGQPTQGMFRGMWLPLLLLAPTLLILLLFLYYPFLDTFRLSTLLASRTRSAFVCLENFTNLAVDAAYLVVVLRTFVFAALIVGVGLALSLGIAILAFQPIKGASIYRTLLIWPYAISPVVAGVIFRLMFNPQGGVINYFTQNMLGVTFDWLNSPLLASATVIMASIWTQLGFNILFYIAGLQSIPKDLIEAAAIDGANAWQRFSRIMLPLLSPITFFLIVTNVTFAFFDIFGTIDYLTEGGPLNATTVMIYNVFDTQRQNLGLGKAAAQSIILFLLVVALTFFQFRTAERRVNYGA
jgi:sn-glycerol 3-phosphate transport system permease protein